MTDPPAPIPSSRWPSPSPSEAPALACTLELWQPSTEESFRQAITERRLVHRTAPIRPVRYVSARYTLRRTPSPTRLDTEFRCRGLSYTQQILPAILALVSSLTREYLPWFSCENIEMRVDFD